MDRHAPKRRRKASEGSSAQKSQKRRVVTEDCKKENTWRTVLTEGTDKTYNLHVTEVDVPYRSGISFMYNVGADMESNVTDMYERLKEAFTRETVSLSQTTNVSLEGLTQVLSGDVYPLSKYKVHLTMQHMEPIAYDWSQDSEDGEGASSSYYEYQHFLRWENHGRSKLLSVTTMDPRKPDRPHPEHSRQYVHDINSLVGPGSLTVTLNAESLNGTLTGGQCTLVWHRAYDDTDPVEHHFDWKCE